MIGYLIWGLDGDHWNVINALATCFSAVGTVGAVVLALWLAGRERKLRVSLYCEINQHTQHIGVTAINSGQLPITVRALCWRVRARRADNIIQTPTFASNPSNLPISLQPGETISFREEMGGLHEKLECLFEAIRLTPKAQLKLGIGVQLTNGTTYFKKLDREFEKFVFHQFSFYKGRVLR